MNERSAGAETSLHVHALVWGVVTLILVLVAERVFSGVAVATGAGAIVYGIAAVTQKHTPIIVIAVGVLGIVTGAIGTLIAISRVMAPQYF